MKIAIWIVLLFASLPLMAKDKACSNATLDGSYAFTIHGQILPPTKPVPVLVDGVAETTFDGNGGLKQVDSVSYNGAAAGGWRPGTGSYSINPDCTGTMTIENEGVPPLNLQIVIGNRGKSIHTMVLNPGFSITSEADLITQNDRDDDHN